MYFDNLCTLDFQKAVCLFVYFKAHALPITILPKHAARKVTLRELGGMVKQRLSNRSEAQPGKALHGEVPKHLCSPGVQHNHPGSSRKRGFPGPTPSL